MLRLALLLLLLAAAPARAQWSPPEVLGSGSSPRAAVARDGSLQVAWTTHRDALLLNGRRVATGAGWLTGPVTYGRRSFAMAWTDLRQRRAAARIGRRAFAVARGRRVASLQLAGNAGGKLALAWFDDRGTRDDAVMVAVRQPGERFGKPRRLASGRLRSVSVAVGERGEVLVAWNTPGRVHARRLGGRAETIRSEEAHLARLQTAFAGRRALVGWVAKFRSEGGDARDTFVQLAERAPGAARFGRARLLARHAGDEGALRLDGGSYAFSTPDGVFVAGGTRVAPPGARLEDFDGTVLWSQDGRLYADGEAIGGPGATGGDLARHPQTGQPAAVWAQDGRVLMASRG